MGSIKEGRKRAGMTQQQVAKLVGCSREHYAKVENGQNTPSNKLAKSIGRELKMDWIEIIKNQGE